MLKTSFVSLVLMSLAFEVSAQTLWQNGGARVESLAYSCDNAIDDLSVAYFTAPDATSFAAVHIAGVVHAMVQDVSASGARFVDIDAESGYSIHSKGDGLLLMKHDAGTPGEDQLLAECLVQKG